MAKFSVTVIDERGCIIDTVDGEAFAQLVGVGAQAQWVWAETMRDVGLTVRRAIEAEMAKRHTGTR